ncbi:hypothetical protein Tco_1439986 [Tanacetum coccineum]
MVSALTASRFHDLSNAYNVAMTRAIELEDENSKVYLEKFKMMFMDNHDQRCFQIEILHLNLQLKHQHLKENVENFKSKPSKDVPEFDAFLNSGIRDDQIQGHKNTILTSNVESPKVSVFEKYAIEVESIPPSQRNNRDCSYHNFLNRNRDTLGYSLVRIVDQRARSKRPSDHSLDYACVYTKQSQELLENVSTLCPKACNKQDKVIATIPLTSKKHVTFADPLETSGNNTTNHVKHLTVQKTNVSIIHSTGVKQTWKPIGKVFTIVGYHWKRTGRIFPLGAQCPLTRNTKPKVVPVKQWKPTGETMQVDMQGLLNATTVKVNVTWLDNALSLSDQGMHHDPWVPDGQAVQTIMPNNVAFQTEDLDTYYSNCDGISNAKSWFKWPLFPNLVWTLSTE